MRRTSTLIFSALVMGLTAAPVSAVELIQNGGFETGNFTPLAGSPTYDRITQGGPQDLTGWTVGNSLVWGVNTTDINPHAGTGFVDLTGIGNTTPHGILNQTISTLVGQQYTFSIFATQDFGGIGFDVLANSVALVLSGAPGFWPDFGTATYGQITGVFTATSTSTTISIAGHANPSFMIGLDDVSVTGPGVGAVPEPSTWAMMLLGFAGLGFAVRRSRRNLSLA